MIRPAASECAGCRERLFLAGVQSLGGVGANEAQGRWAGNVLNKEIRIMQNLCAGALRIYCRPHYLTKLWR